MAVSELPQEHRASVSLSHKLDARFGQYEYDRWHRIGNDDRRGWVEAGYIGARYA